MAFHLKQTKQKVSVLCKTWYLSKADNQHTIMNIV